VLAACAPRPKNVPCGNGGDCTKIDARYSYCLESRCVECVSSSSCGEGRSCTDGVCVCSSDVGCPGQQCAEGACKPR
jgi:hypothetical protein